MFNKFLERENTIFLVLSDLVEHSVPFIIVGGYAVSAYKHRFSVDADIIIKKESLPLTERLLKKRKFVKTVV